MKSHYQLFFIIFLIVNLLVACSSNPKEIEDKSPSLYKDLNIVTDYDIGTSYKKLSDDLGKPQKDTFYLGGRLVMYGKEGYFLDDNDKIYGMFITDPNVTIGKVKVGMTLGEMKAVLGEPDEAFFDEGETQFYYTIYRIDDFKITFCSVDETSPTEYAMVVAEDLNI